MYLVSQGGEDWLGDGENLEVSLIFPACFYLSWIQRGRLGSGSRWLIADVRYDVYVTYVEALIASSTDQCPHHSTHR